MVTPYAVFLRRTSSLLAQPASTRIALPWQVNDLTNIGMWDPLDPSWVYILVNGIYQIKTSVYLQGTGQNTEFGVNLWLQAPALAGQYGENRWLDINNPVGTSGLATQPQRTSIPYPLLAGQRVGTEVQSDHDFDVLVNPNPQNDPTRPDQRFVYPVLSVVKVSDLP